MRAGLAIALSAVALTACGGSSSPATPSGLNPASMVPAKSLFYVSLSVRPQGTLKQDLVQLIDDVGGANAATDLVSKVTGGSGSAQNTWSQVKPWLGQRVGAALIGLPPEQVTEQSLLNYAVLILPTTDPKAASSYLSSKLGHQTLLTYKVVGDYALIGGAYAVQMASAVTGQTSLARSPNYRQLIGRIGGGALVALYERPSALVNFEVKILSAEPVPPANLGEIKDALRKLPVKASGMVTFNVTPGTVRMESASVGIEPQKGSTQSSAAGVARLPADSWLAASIGGALTQGSMITSLESAFRKLSAAESARLGTADSGGLQFVTDDLLPALGPMSLSISGQSKASVKVGFALTPASQSAGDKLLSVVQRMLGKHAAQVKLGHDGDQLVATYGYKSFGEMLTPAASLSSNPAFQQALKQLPSGSSASVFVNFGPIEALAALDHSSKDASAVKVLSHLEYLIAGGQKGRFELVLGVK